MNRLYGVLNKRLADRDFVAGDFFSIADMAIWPWASLWERQHQDITQFAHMKAWLDRCYARPAVQKSRALAKDLRQETQSKEAQRTLFGQKAR